jgi:uncharacterized membrane protein YccC
MGCATTDELEAVKVSLTTSLSAAKRHLDSRIHQLENDRKQWEALHAQMLKLAKSQEDTVARISELDIVHQEHGRVLSGQQEALTKVRETVKVTAKDVAELRAVWEGEEGALAHLLEAEEAVYREGLSTIQRIRGEWMNLKGRSPGSLRRTEASLER